MNRVRISNRPAPPHGGWRRRRPRSSSATSEKSLGPIRDGRTQPSKRMSMSKTRTSLLIAGLAACAVAAGIGGIMWVRSQDPLRGSPDEIRSALLKEARLGSRADAVKGVAISHGWSDKLSEAQSSCRDFGRSREATPEPLSSGPKSMVARVGRFDEKAHMPAFVLVCWEFDGGGMLRDVVVTKGLEKGAVF